MVKPEGWWLTVVRTCKDCGGRLMRRRSFVHGPRPRNPHKRYRYDLIHCGCLSVNSQTRKEN